MRMLLGGLLGAALLLGPGGARADVLTHANGVSYTTGGPGTLAANIGGPGTAATGAGFTLSISLTETGYGGFNLAGTTADFTCSNCATSYQQINTVSPSTLTSLSGILTVPGAAQILATDLTFTLVGNLWTAGIADEASHYVTMAFDTPGLFTVGLLVVATQSENWTEHSWGTASQPAIVPCAEPPFFICVGTEQGAFDTGQLSGTATYNLISSAEAQVLVPEPASAAVLGLGVLALMGRRRRSA